MLPFFSDSSAGQGGRTINRNSRGNEGSVSSGMKIGLFSLPLNGFHYSFLS
jgi:hypothetical protein